MSSSAAGVQEPTQTQLLFARAVVLTMELWPAMRLAVSEQWGGQESAEKREFLISHICDTYSNEHAAQTTSSVGSTSSAHVQPPATPDIDDLAETLEMYFADEYESRIEDGSADWVAGRIVQLHKTVYSTFPPTSDSLANAQTEVDKLYQAAVQLRGQKVSVQRSSEADLQADSESGDSEGDEDEAMQLDEAEQSEQSRRQERQEPVVDEDGFTTVVKGRRRP